MTILGSRIRVSDPVLGGFIYYFVYSDGFLVASSAPTLRRSCWLQETLRVRFWSERVRLSRAPTPSPSETRTQSSTTESRTWTAADSISR